ncbi:MAG: hypothetical protein HY717_13330 [Planctomycetes bacterium]|nr:hypothetical protein [Planctomycetota bacterium]
MLKLLFRNLALAAALLAALGAPGCFFNSWKEDESEFSIEPGMWRLHIEGDKHDSSEGENAPAVPIDPVNRLVKVVLKFNDQDQETVEVYYAGEDTARKANLREPITGLIKENAKKKGRFYLDLLGRDENWEFRMWGEIESPTKIRTGNIVGADPLGGHLKFQGVWSMEKTKN